MVQQKKLVLLLVSLVLSAVLCELVLRVLPDGLSAQPYYRPHEKYERETSYATNVDEVFPMPHGDLVAIDPLAPAAIRQPRVVHFKTDKLGYRNDAGYGAQQLVLVGDSMIVGTGNDQKDILTNVLIRQRGLDSYSIAYPTGPKGYFEAVERFLARVAAPFSVTMFFFEGNDFHGPGRPTAGPGPYDALKIDFWWKLRPAFTAGLHVFNATRQWERILLPRSDTATEVYRIGRQYMGFYGSYIDKAAAGHLRFDPGDPPPEVMERIKAVYFVPTKYRVYFPMLGDSRGRCLSDPPPGYVALKAFFDSHDIPVLDLTRPLVRRAHELLEQDRYVYWRDDTHWNVNAVSVVAAEIATSPVQRNGTDGI